jgi:hypothetical protein
VASTLASYLASTRRHLKDANAQYWTDTNLTAYIGEAMQKVAVDAGHLRYVITSQLIANQRDYAISYPTPLPTVAGSVGFAAIIGFYDLWVIATGGSTGTRMRLRNPSWQELQAFTNQWTSAVGIPEAWAKLGAAQISFGPTPALAYFVEFGVKLIPNVLVNTTDADPSPYPFTEPVPYYAAYLAKIEQQQYNEAKQFYNADANNMGLYQQRLLEAIASTPDVIPDIYGTDGAMPWGWVR